MKDRLLIQRVQITVPRSGDCRSLIRVSIAPKHYFSNLIDNIKFSWTCPSLIYRKIAEKFAQLDDCAYICSQIAAQMELRRDVFQAIADPTRRAIITLVALHAMTPGAIAENFESSRQTISKHIQILTECEILELEQNGREIYYHLNPQKIKEIADFVEPFRKLWDERFNKLETIMKKHQSKK